MSNNLEVIETIFENDLQRILKCRNNENGDIFLNNIIFNANLIKLINVAVLNDLNSNIEAAYKDDDRLYIISRLAENNNQHKIKDYIRKGLTFKQQFCLAEQLISLAIEIDSSSDLLQFKIMNEENLTVDNYCNLKVNGDFEFTNEFDISDNFTFKNLGNILHFVFSGEEIIDYNLSDNVPPEVRKIIVSCLVRDYSNPREIMRDFKESPIYGIVNCSNKDENKYETVHTGLKPKGNDISDIDLTDSDENISNLENDNSKDGNIVAAAVAEVGAGILANELLGENVEPTETDEKSVEEVEPTEADEESVEEVEPTEADVESVEEVEPTETNEKSVEEVEPTETDEKSVEEVEPAETDEESVEEIEPAETDEESVEEVEPTETNASDNIQAATLGFAAMSNEADFADDFDAEKNIEVEEESLENVIDVYLSEKDNETSDYDSEDKKTGSKHILLPIFVVVFVAILSVFIIKSLYSDKNNEILPDPDNDKNTEIVDNNNKDNSTDKENEDKDDTSNEENQKPDDSVEEAVVDESKYKDVFNQELIDKFEYTGVTAKYEVVDGKTYLVAENTTDEKIKVLFTVLDFKGDNAYMQGKQIEIIAKLLANKSATIGLEVQANGKNNSSKLANIEVYDDTWSTKTISIEVKDMDSIMLFLNLEKGQKIWIDQVSVNMAK